MSDGHSDAIRYSRFYEENRSKQTKIDDIELVLKSGEVINIDDVSLVSGDSVFTLHELVKSMLKIGWL